MASSSATALPSGPVPFSSILFHLSFLIHPPSFILLHSSSLIHPLSFIIPHSSSLIHSPSSILPHSSSLIHPPSFILPHPSSLIHPPSSILPHSSSLIHPPSFILLHPSSFIHPSSSILPHPSSLIHFHSSIFPHSSIFIHTPLVHTILFLILLQPILTTSIHPFFAHNLIYSLFTCISNAYFFHPFLFTNSSSFLLYSLLLQFISSSPPSSFSSLHPSYSCPLFHHLSIQSAITRSISYYAPASPLH